MPTCSDYAINCVYQSFVKDWLLYKKGWIAISSSHRPNSEKTLNPHASDIMACWYETLIPRLPGTTHHTKTVSGN